jgi:hypothetical protein
MSLARPYAQITDTRHFNAAPRIMLFVINNAIVFLFCAICAGMAILKN